ncbi:MAG: glycosyltransferase [Chthoniobacterales bacterium]
MPKHLSPTDLFEKADELRDALDKLRQAVLMPTEAPLPLLETVRTKLDALRRSARVVGKELAGLEARFAHMEREAWDQRARRADATARLKKNERLLADIQGSALWKVVKPAWNLLHRAARKKAATKKPIAFCFEVETPESWETAAEIILIRGWCFAASGRPLAGVRAKVGRKSRFAAYGLERLDVFARNNAMPASRHSGFSAELRVPHGTSLVQLEAIEQGGDWELFYEHELNGRGNYAGDERAAEKELLAAELPRFQTISAEKAVLSLKPLFHEHSERATSAAPRFSVITPTFNTTPQWFVEAAMSLLTQASADWEWCIVDDGSTSRATTQLLQQLRGVSPRLRIELRANAGISAATNAALDLATGEFVCFLDHDDLLDPRALQEMEKALQGDVQVAYSDEDKLREPDGAQIEPFFKPDWSPEYFRGVMYVGHLLCLRRELAMQTRFNPAFDGVQDFEFMLRVSETGAKIAHVPLPLYHWRKTPGSIAENSDAKPEIGRMQERAVNAHLARLGLPAHAESLSLPHRLRMVPFPRATHPRISIIIPTKDSPELLRRCVASVRASSYPDYEIVVVDNDTTDAEALRVMEECAVTRVPFPGTFNFSRANNRGAQQATGTFLVFLNNDTEIISPDWLHQLLYYAEQKDVGAAGALLVYEDRTVQHGGVALGMRGTADHMMRGFPLDADGYAGSLACAREVSAVTAACMMIRKSLFEEIGGFNEHFFTAYQDVDLCLRLQTRGLRIIYTPEAKVVHHEWTSRKTYYDMVDRMLLLDQWEEVIDRGDPYYNRHLDLERGDYSIAPST